MEHFVTLFDSLFMPQGLALHMSMERHLREYTLWILCVDDETFKALQFIRLPNVRLLQLSVVETAELKRVKSVRSKGEYCWTLTPFAPRFVFEADSSVSRVTYVDADVWFRKSPELIFHEFDTTNKSVLITDHAYSPEYDQSAVSGEYCVQFMIFKRESSELVRKWWENCCIDWCYARFEDGKFGDQKYLDEWPDLFDGLVHVLQRKEYALAPWNATRYPYGQGIFYHFHGLRISEERQIDFGPMYVLPKVLIENVYEPYISDLVMAIKNIESQGLVVMPQVKKLNTIKLIKRYLSGVLRQFKNNINLNFCRY